MTKVFDPIISVRCQTLASTEEFTSASVVSFVYEHGRKSLNQKVADYSASLTFVREDVENLLTTYGWTLGEFCAFGNYVSIEKDYPLGKDTDLVFYVTDVNRDRDTITLSGVDAVSFRSSRLAEQTFPGFIGTIPDGLISPSGGIAQYLDDAALIGIYDETTTTESATIIVATQNYSSVPAFVSSILEALPTTWLLMGRQYQIGFPTYARAGVTSSYLVDRPNDLSTVTTFATLTDDEVLDVIQYSRNISDAITVSTATNSAAGYISQIIDDQAITGIGYVDSTVEAVITQDDLDILAGARLAAQSMRASPVLTISTTWKLCGNPFWIPNVLLDVSAITSPDFDGIDKVWIENISATMIGNDVQFTLTVSDARFTSHPERWNEVDPLLQWNQVDPALTWIDALTTDIN